MNVEIVTWDDQRLIEEILAAARTRFANYLLVQPTRSDSANLRAIPSGDSAELIVIRNARQTSRWQSLNRILPAELYLLAVLPDQHEALAISIAAAERIPDWGLLQSLDELVLRIARQATVSFVDDGLGGTQTRSIFPSLTFAAGVTRPQWVATAIERLTSENSASTTQLAALKAGLYLFHDFFDESHQASQSIEGQGRWHTGDYWHAILHRREPDSGNAQYWFRRVGRHPIFLRLAEIAQQHFDVDEPSLANRLEPWKARLVTREAWNPLAFIDLCGAAANDPVLKAWCEELQYDEMVLLLESTAQEASAVQMFSR